MYWKKTVNPGGARWGRSPPFASSSALPTLIGSIQMSRVHAESPIAGLSRQATLTFILCPSWCPQRFQIFASLLGHANYIYSFPSSTSSIYMRAGGMRYLLLLTVMRALMGNQFVWPYVTCARSVSHEECKLHFPAAMAAQSVLPSPAVDTVMLYIGLRRVGLVSTAVTLALTFILCPSWCPLVS